MKKGHLRDSLADLVAQSRDLGPQHVNKRLAALIEFEVVFEHLQLLRLLVERVGKIRNFGIQCANVRGGHADAVCDRSDDLGEGLHLVVECGRFVLTLRRL